MIFFLQAKKRKLGLLGDDLEKLASEASAKDDEFSNRIIGEKVLAVTKSYGTG